MGTGPHGYDDIGSSATHAYGDFGLCAPTHRYSAGLVQMLVY